MHITVVLSVLNGEKYLCKAVDSILNQTHSDFTFITIDNGSSDSTSQILDDYAAKDSRVHVVHNHETVTLVEARMQGVHLAKTEWVAWMDADDISMPERLELEIALIKNNSDELGAVGTWAYYINKNEEKLGIARMKPNTIEEFHTMYANNDAIVLMDPTAIVNKESFLAAGGYRPICTPAGDLDLWYRMTELGKLIQVIPEPLLYYRVHPGSDSVKKTMLQRKKTHFINYNMRLRRSGQNELNWEQYLDKVWGSLLYKLPRLRNDIGLSHYKHAGLYYGSRQYGPFLYHLFIASLIKPIYVVKRIILQQKRRATVSGS